VSGTVPGAEVIEILVSWTVTTAMTFAVVIFDERRMSEERLERAWPTSTRAVAIVYLGILALPFHFARTRGSVGSVRGLLGIPLGLIMGVVVALVIGVIAGLLDSVVAWALGVPE
jgi:hypothetical protein